MRSSRRTTEASYSLLRSPCLTSLDIALRERTRYFCHCVR